MTTSFRRRCCCCSNILLLFYLLVLFFTTVCSLSSSSSVLTFTFGSNYKRTNNDRRHRRTTSNLAATSSSNSRNSKSSNTFPLSTKQALIAKSKIINPSLPSSQQNQQQNEELQQYTSMGWSNRPRTILTPTSIHPNAVYTADRSYYWNTINVGCRMTVIELSSSSSCSNNNGNNSGGLWVHSPVGLDGPTREAIRTLERTAGPVKYIVSPNYEHVKFVPQWADAFPNAELWGCPGLVERMPQLPWTGELPHSCRPPTWTTTTTTSTTSTGDNDDSNSSNTASSTSIRSNHARNDGDGIGWDWNEIQPLHVDTEVNPFTNEPFFNEVIFYHTASKTLLTTDLYWNYPNVDGVPNSNYNNVPYKNEQDWGEWELAPSVPTIPIGSQLWKVGMDRIFRPFYLNYMVRSRSEFEDICQFVTTVWDVETLIPAHGDIVRGNDFIRTILRDFFNLSTSKE